MLTICLLLTVSIITLVACTQSGDAPHDSAKNGYELNINTVYALAEEANYTGSLEDLVAMFKGKDGADGKGIVSVTKTKSEENVDIYTITYSDETSSTFTITNGKDGIDGNQRYQRFGWRFVTR